ncbi:MAG: hypothetical protein SV422_15925, partial [Pseudomonadota bacterium]|nr:hypothetical protein [Pseudomonadota bacterium]
WELTWEFNDAPRVPWLLSVETLDASTPAAASGGHDAGSLSPPRVEHPAFARYRPQLDALAAQQEKDLGDRIVVRKNADYVSRRYLQHPLERYTLLFVKHRITRKLLGLCVLKAEAERVLWMDAIAPHAHLPALAQVARAEAWKLQHRKLALWCCEPDVTRFGAVNTATALPITTPANVWSPGPKPEELKDRWWLLAGDTDWL